MENNEAEYQSDINSKADEENKELGEAIISWRIRTQDDPPEDPDCQELFDYSRSQHDGYCNYGIIDYDEIKTLLHQVRQGYYIQPWRLLHFTDAECNAVDELLCLNRFGSESGIGSNTLLAWVAHEHFAEFYNRELTTLIISHLLTHGMSEHDIITEVEAEYSVIGEEFPDFVTDIARETFRKKLDSELSNKAVKRKVKI